MEDTFNKEVNKEEQSIKTNMDLDFESINSGDVAASDMDYAMRFPLSPCNPDVHPN